jgi:hypothetical protein
MCRRDSLRGGCKFSEWFPAQRKARHRIGRPGSAEASRIDKRYQSPLRCSLRSGKPRFPVAGRPDCSRHWSESPCSRSRQQRVELTQQDQYRGTQAQHGDRRSCGFWSCRTRRAGRSAPIPRRDQLAAENHGPRRTNDKRRPVAALGVRQARARAVSLSSTDTPVCALLHMFIRVALLAVYKTAQTRVSVLPSEL